MSPREEAIARVRAALDRDSTCAWAIAPESVAHLMAAYDEVCKEREEYRAVIARQIEDKRRLLVERDEARQHHQNARRCGYGKREHHAPDGGGCAGDFAEQLPKGPTHGRFTDAERQEIEDLKKKAFETAKNEGGAS